MTFTAQNMSGTKNPRWKGGRPSIKCEICDIEFLGYLHRKSRYCSRQCCGKAKIGIKHTEEWKQKMKGKTAGEKNYNWKGNKVSYSGLHKWIKRQKGKARKCELCNKEKTSPKSIQWANKSHQYKRDLSDWIQLCASCHRYYDIAKTGNSYGKSIVP